MQIIDLVHGKTFMEDHNLTAPTDTILDDLKTFTALHSYYDGRIEMSWKLQYNVPLAFIVTKYGLCLSFNMMTHQNLFKK
jgi:hypothetical protein